MTAGFSILLLLSCRGEPTTAGGEADRVECAIAGAAAFEPVCTVERTEDEEGLVLTIRAPDGGFRRLLVTEDGRVAAADGADPALVTILSDDRIEVAIADDRYRLPAAIEGAQRPAP